MEIRLSRIFTGMIASSAMLTFLSCGDDAAPSKTPLLVGKLWTFVRYEVNGADQTEECQTDDTMTFYSDGTFTNSVGDITCDEFDTDIDGTWTFKANETIISLTPSGDVESDWKILDLTDTMLRISQHIDVLDAEVTIIMSPNQ
jgi:hypothetical protein